MHLNHSRIASIFLAAPALLLGCGGAQDLFTDSRQQIACGAAIPVCTTTAGCVLDGTNYTGGSFAQGGTRRFIVRTTGGASIEVDLFFATETSPGTDTEVDWYEAACGAELSADSGGADVFSEAGPGQVWSRTEKVATGGDHLVQVFSDAQADYLLRVVVTPGQ